MDDELRYFLEQGPTSVKELARLTGKSTSAIYKAVKDNPDVLKIDSLGNDPTQFLIQSDAPESAVDGARASETASVGEAPTESPAASPATSPGRRGRKPTAAGQKLFPTKDENPRRAGTHGHKSMAIIHDNPGVTTEQFVEQGGRLNDLRWDIEKSNVRLEG